MDEESLSTSTTPPSLDGGQSLGIGLAVVARYVRNMNGQIRVRSELGKGTIFGIELPFEHALGVPATSHEQRSLSRPPRPLSATDTRTTQDNTDSSNSTIISSSLGKLKMLDSVESSPSTGVEPQDIPTPGSNPKISPESDDGDNTSTLSSPSSARSLTFPFPNMPVAPSSTSREHGFLNVLIAEDNPINAKLLTKRLQNLGHTVELSSDGQECHDHFAAKPHGIDVILMDLQVRRSYWISIE